MSLVSKLTFSLPLLLVGLAVSANAQANVASKQQAVHAGQQIFLQRCMQCHSVNPNQVVFGPSLYGELTTSPHKKTAAQVRVILKNGKGKMPVFGAILSEKDVDNLLAYLHSL
jgi:mono/diheme cytochrome c family protein